MYTYQEVYTDLFLTANQKTFGLLIDLPKESRQILDIRNGSIRIWIRFGT